MLSFSSAILEQHPDKGGDATVFRRTRTAFEVLRELKTNGTITTSFTTHLKDAADKYYDSVFDDFTTGETPSYEHYYQAAQEHVPSYKVELARSGRSQCVACKGKQNNKGKKATKTASHGSNSEPLKKKARTSKHKAKDGETDTTLIVAPLPVTTNPTSSYFIPKDDIRVGSLDETAGSYGRWNHLQCWRVPYRIWAGLTKPEDPKQVLQDLLYMEDVLLTNLSALNREQQVLFVQHVIDQSNWARKTKASKPPPDLKAAAAAAKQAAKSTSSSAQKKQDTPPNTKTSAPSAKPQPHHHHHHHRPLNAAAAPFVPSSTTLAVAAAATSSSSAAVVTKTDVKERFVVPRPGLNGAIVNVLEKKTFVLTGVFPEVGGGAGLNLGKDRVKAMIESFGGRVTSGVSGKTNYVVVGKAPGMSKVSQAHGRGIPLVDLRALQTRILGQAETLEEAAGPGPRIESYSAGYQSAGYLTYY